VKPFSKEHIAQLKDRFNALAGRYLSDDVICNDHIELKREHTLKVYDEIKSLAEEIGFTQENIMLACIIALFHDIGRFEQFNRFRTFDDSSSLNHAALSIEILRSDGFMDDIPEAFHDIIFRTIINHNIPVFQVRENDEVALFTKLLRDADKLDIWRVITQDELRRILEWKEHTDKYDVPDVIFQRFRDHQIVTLDLVRSVNDMRLLRIGWIFDINFSVTFERIKERKLLEKIFVLIPRSERIDQIKTIAVNYLGEKMTNPRVPDTITFKQTLKDNIINQ
jgi:putative nucleotidyltransferase with HDIG domain